MAAASMSTSRFSLADRNGWLRPDPEGESGIPARIMTPKLLHAKVTPSGTLVIKLTASLALLTAAT
jgi:hypothetical protein